MQPTYLLVVFAIVVQHSFAQNLHDIIQKCKVSDPKFNDCALNSANNLMATVLHGTDKSGMPYVTATENTTVGYIFPDNYTLKLINLTSDFYKKFVVKNIHFNFDKKLLLFGMESGPSIYTARYETDGSILGKQAIERGNVNMTFDNIQLNAVVTLDFKMKDDKKYLEAVSCILNFDFKNFHFKPYDRLTVGEPMTAEQDKVFDSYIAKIPSLLQRDNEKADEGVVEALNRLFGYVPFDQLFLP